jgi:hypothetical protein
MKSEKNYQYKFDKKMILIYSLYLAIGSIAFFIFINGIYTTIQANIWHYSLRYITNSIVFTVVTFISCILLFATCILILKTKKYAKIFGLIGCLLLIFYPLYIYLVDIITPYNFNYIFILFFPALISVIISLFYWRKYF